MYDVISYTHRPAGRKPKLEGKVSEDNEFGYVEIRNWMLIDLMMKFQTLLLFVSRIISSLLSLLTLPTNG